MIRLGAEAGQEPLGGLGPKARGGWAMASNTASDASGCGVGGAEGIDPEGGAGRPALALEEKSSESMAAEARAAEAGINVH